MLLMEIEMSPAEENSSISLQLDSSSEITKKVAKQEDSAIYCADAEPCQLKLSPSIPKRSTGQENPLLKRGGMARHAIEPIIRIQLRTDISNSAIALKSTVKKKGSFFSDFKASIRKNRQLDPMKKSLKRSAHILSAASHPEPTEQVILFGKRLIFNYSLSHLLLSAWTFGFIDCDSFNKIGIYCSIMTGNVVSLGLEFAKGNYSKVGVLLIVIVANTVGGTCLMCFLLEHTQDRVKTSAILISLLCLVCMLIMLLDVYCPLMGYWLVGILRLAITVCMGANMYSIHKLGYSCGFVTLNMFKTTEVFYRAFRNIEQGGAKTRGELVSVLLIILSFTVGTYCAGLSILHLRQLSLLPVVLSFGLHLLVTGAWPQNWSILPHFKRYCCGLDASGDAVPLYFGIERISSPNCGSSSEGPVRSVQRSVPDSSSIGLGSHFDGVADFSYPYPCDDRFSTVSPMAVPTGSDSV